MQDLPADQPKKKPKLHRQFLERLSSDEDHPKDSHSGKSRYLDEELKQAEFSEDPSSEIEKAVQMEQEQQQ